MEEENKITEEEKEQAEKLREGIDIIEQDLNRSIKEYHLFLAKLTLEKKIPSILSGLTPEDQEKLKETPHYKELVKNLKQQIKEEEKELEEHK